MNDLLQSTTNALEALQEFRSVVLQDQPDVYGRNREMFDQIDLYLERFRGFPDLDRTEKFQLSQELRDWMTQFHHLILLEMMPESSLLH